MTVTRSLELVLCWFATRPSPNRRESSHWQHHRLWGVTGSWSLVLNPCQKRNKSLDEAKVIDYKAEPKLLLSPRIAMRFELNPFKQSWTRGG